MGNPHRDFLKCQSILKDCDIGMTYKYDRLFNQERRSETITRESLYKKIMV